MSITTRIARYIEDPSQKGHPGEILYQTEDYLPLPPVGSDIAVDGVVYPVIRSMLELNTSTGEAAQVIIVQ